MTDSTNEPIDEERRAQLERYLGQLSIGYYAVGALMALVGLLPLLYVALGVAMMSGAFGHVGDDEMIGGVIMLVVGAVLSLLFWVQAVVLLVAGNRMGSRRSRVFLFVAAGVACLNQPFGIVLGVLTFILLTKPGVAELFEEADLAG